MNLKYLAYFEPIYGSFLLSYFINNLNDKGNKASIETHLYKFFVFLKIKWRDNPFLVFFESIEKGRPTLIISFKQKINRNKKIITIIPTQINLHKQYRQVIKWLKLGLIFQLETSDYFVKFFMELINLYIHNKSFILDKKVENYKLIVQNKFNKHYRW